MTRRDDDHDRIDSVNYEDAERDEENGGWCIYDYEDKAWFLKSPTQAAVASTAMDAKTDNANYVGMVNEWCQSNGVQSVDFDYKGTGPSHMLTFKCIATIKLRAMVLHAEATAASKKAAKNMACQDLYAQIKLQGRGAPN